MRWGESTCEPSPVTTAEASPVGPAPVFWSASRNLSLEARLLGACIFHKEKVLLVLFASVLRVKEEFRYTLQLVGHSRCLPGRAEGGRRR